MSNIPNTLNLLPVARRVLKEDCRLLVISDSNADLAAAGRLADQLYVELSPDTFAGRMVRAVEGSGYGVVCRTSGLGGLSWAFPDINASGTTDWAPLKTGYVFKTASNVLTTGTVTANGRFIDSIINNDVTSKNSGWWKGRDMYVRPIYFNITGYLANGGPKMLNFLKIAAFSGGSAITPLTITSLMTGSNPGITGFDFYCRDYTTESVNVRLTSSTGNITGSRFLYYGSLFYRAASGTPTNTVAGLQIDSIGSDYGAAQYNTPVLCDTGHLREYMKMTRDPNCFMILLGQYDLYGASYLTNISGLVSKLTTISTANGVTDPKFLLISPWSTHATGAWANMSNDLHTMASNSSGVVSFLNLSTLLGSQRNISEHNYFDENEVNSGTTPGYGIHLSTSGYNYVARIINEIFNKVVNLTGMYGSTKSSTTNVINNQFYTKTTNNPVLGNSLGVALQDVNATNQTLIDYSPQYHDWVPLTTGNGYPNPDTTGVGSISYTRDINGQPINHVRTTRESFEIVAGLGDTTVGSGWTATNSNGQVGRSRPVWFRKT